jgi:hypothetical protein
MPLPGFATLNPGYGWADGGGPSVAWASSYRTLPRTGSVTRLFARQRRNPTSRVTASLLKARLARFDGYFLPGTDGFACIGDIMVLSPVA